MIYLLTGEAMFGYLLYKGDRVALLQVDLASPRQNDQLLREKELPNCIDISCCIVSVFSLRIQTFPCFDYGTVDSLFLPNYLTSLASLNPSRQGVLY